LVLKVGGRTIERIKLTRPGTELDTFANESEVMWRGFVASAVAAVSLQWVNPFGTSKLVLFQVTNVGDTWRAFELVSLTAFLFSKKLLQCPLQIPWLTLGVIGVNDL
jgi:chloride channel 3/4/5